MVGALLLLSVHNNNICAGLNTSSIGSIISPKYAQKLRVGEGTSEKLDPESLWGRSGVLFSSLETA